MWIPIAGLIIGLSLGIFLPFNLTVADPKFSAIIAISAIDSIFIGFRSRLNNSFNANLFIVEFVLNTIIAMVLISLGYIMNTDLFTAIAIIFMARIFYNLSGLNHQLFSPNENKS
jgi:small basic protein